MAPYDLKDPSYRFEKREFKAGHEGQWLANEMGSIHQTFTEDEEPGAKTGQKHVPPSKVFDDRSLAWTPGASRMKSHVKSHVKRRLLSKLLIKLILVLTCFNLVLTSFSCRLCGLLF